MRRPALALVLLLPSLAALPKSARADDLEARRSPVVRAVERARPGVVSIRTNEIVQVPRYYDWYFSGGTTVPQEREGALGSGAIFHPAGFVITNAHVISRASKIFVQVSEGPGRDYEREARLVSVDLDNDLAILRLVSPDGGPSRYPYLPLGRSDDLMIGETVIAIGNPFRLGITVTTGILSALHRSIRPRTEQETEFRDFLQTDAAINPGNSGGPLFDVTGRWIGVNTAILNRSMGAEGIGFAIPADRVREMIGRTFKRRLVTGEWTGFDLQTGPAGAPLVSEVAASGPAQEAGLRRGDRIVSVGGQTTPTLFDYRIAEIEVPDHQPLRLQVAREGAGTIDLTVPLAPLPVASLSRSRLGFVARDVVPADARTLGVAVQGGIVVTEVDEDGPAERVRLKANDVVVAVGKDRIRTLDDLVDVLELLRTGDVLELRVRRVVQDGLGNAAVREMSGRVEVR